MRSFLDRLTFQQRLEGLVAVSTLMVLLFSGYVLYGSWQTATESRSISQLARRAVATSQAVHELQKERGRSSGFIGAKGQQFASELDGQRKTSDASLAALDQVVAEMDVPGSVTDALGAAGKRRLALGAMRDSVQTLKVPAPEAISFYAGLIADHLAAVDELALVPSHGDLVRRLVAYANFLQAKENAGLERAVLSNAFGADQLTPALYKTFSGVVASEQTRLALFRTHARPEHVAAFERTVSGSEVAQAAQWRGVAFEHAYTGSFGVKPADWFAVATRRIDLMKEVEDVLSRDIVDTASAEQRRADQTMMLALAMTVVAMLFGIGGAILLGRMTSRALSAVAAELDENAQQVVSAARQVAGSAQSLAQGATEQAASLEETSASMEEMASMTHKNSDHAAEAATLVSGMASQVEVSNGALAEMVESMDALEASSARVGRIIKTIEEIAFQTNILALNAAVEAARAGEAGMGFAVVAEEVRSLAQRSSQAAKDTAALIEESIERSHRGAARVQQVASAITAITQSVSSVTRIVENVREASRQQTSGIDQVAQALTQMEQVTQSTAATAEESAAASEELNAQAESSIHVVHELKVLVHGTSGAGQPVHVAGRRTAAPISLLKPAPAKLRAVRARRDDSETTPRTGTFGTF